jgi:hypothetical protein
MVEPVVPPVRFTFPDELHATMIAGVPTRARPVKTPRHSEERGAMVSPFFALARRERARSCR